MESYALGLLDPDGMKSERRILADVSCLYDGKVHLSPLGLIDD
jgi:hypothetical protein